MRVDQLDVFVQFVEGSADVSRHHDLVGVLERFRLMHLEEEILFGGEEIVGRRWRRRGLGLRMIWEKSFLGKFE